MRGIMGLLAEAGTHRPIELGSQCLDISSPGHLFHEGLLPCQERLQHGRLAAEPALQDLRLLGIEVLQLNVAGAVLRTRQLGGPLVCLAMISVDGLHVRGVLRVLRVLDVLGIFGPGIQVPRVVEMLLQAHSPAGGVPQSLELKGSRFLGSRYPPGAWVG